MRFVLAGSGHIAGIVNPPAANKYGFWTNSRKAKSPDTWLKSATQHDGSWWTDWRDWIAPFGGGKVPARKPSSWPPPLKSGSMRMRGFART